MIFHKNLSGTISHLYQGSTWSNTRRLCVHASSPGSSHSTDLHKSISLYSCSALWLL